MPISIKHFPSKSVKSTAAEICIATSIRDDLEINDLLENIILLLKYIKKRPKNKDESRFLFSFNSRNVKLDLMLKRIWFPGLIALIIIGLIYWFFIRTPGPAAVGDGQRQDAYSTGSEQPGISKGISGPVDLSAADMADTLKSNQNIMNATLHTNYGDITIQFDPSTPNTVANFVKLAKSGFYDGTKFHRVIKGFMDQGGDPLSKDDSQMARWGTGGPGYQFADEIGANNRNDAGTIAMANAGPNTNGSQFFLNAAANNFLDDKHTVFGKVVAGLDVVMAINGVETTEPGRLDRPVTPVVIKSIDLK